MYRLIKKWKNISGLKSHKNIVYFNENGNLIEKDNIILNDVESDCFWFINEGLYFFNKEGVRFYMKNEKFVEVKTPFFTNSIFENKILCKVNFRRENRKWKWEFGVYDMDRNFLSKEFEIQNFNSELVFKGNAIGFFNKDRFASINYENGELNWDLELGDNVSKIIGIHKNEVFLITSNSKLIAVNIEKGVITNSWFDLSNISLDSQTKGLTLDGVNFVLDKNSEKLIGALHNNYIKLDLKTNAIHFVNITEELQKNKIIFIKQLNNNPFTDTHLFLTAMMQQEDNDKKWSKDCLFALNRITHKIDWLHIFEEQNLGTNIPKLTETELYQLDNNGNLFVFKKEENYIS
ncbi:hypothetical protein [Polaribacter sp. L3A8]|uniref:hypothetical protein n=1 Tax=Polaribacter sp. L3A8 TaxID=2686361 RepID=UPI00131E8A93|nr:hypothetical protein [Polaribacter sp. L3A8]